MKQHSAAAIDARNVSDDARNVSRDAPIISRDARSVSSDPKQTPMSAWHIHVICLFLILAIAGCDSGVSKGKSLTDYIGRDAVVIGLSGYTVKTKTNRQGRDIPGFSIDGVCLIRDRQEFETARCQTYAIIREVVTRGLLKSRFWEQVREKRIGLGSPFLHTDMVSVVFVTVDDEGRIQDYHTKRGAHFTISVSTNEFTKQWRLD
jgi:hypothetical protein